jgi:HEAT repeat protein
MMLLVLALVAASRPATAQVGSPVATTEASEPGAQDEIAVLGQILSGLDASDADREEAARRLLARQTDEPSDPARDRIQQALISLSNPAGQLAVARALSDDGGPDQALIAPLAALIGNHPQYGVELSQAAAHALANYRGDDMARVRLQEAAQDTRLRPQVRAQVVLALGAVPDKRIAGLLVGLVASESEPLIIRHSAAEALSDLAGQATPLDDPSGWLQWWEQNKAKTAEQFAADVQAARSERLADMRNREERQWSGAGDGELGRMLNELYRGAPDEQKDEILLRYLRSAVPQVRAIGARNVSWAFRQTKPISPAGRARLRSMIGDSSPAVREAVATAVGDINDPAALDLLLQQLSHEQVASVRQALAEALANTQDPRAAEPLLALLDDPLPDVVRAAAHALGQIGAALRQNDPPLADRASVRLDLTLRRYTDSAQVDVRVALVDAIGAMRNPEMRNTFFRLLGANEPAAVRRSALRGLGQFTGAEEVAVNILNSDAFEDPDETVRLAAIDALRSTANATHAQRLYERFRDPRETERVRLSIWTVLESLFPKFETEQLGAWADRFSANPDAPADAQRDDHERRLIILRALKDKLNDGRSLDELARQQENIGSELVALGRYDEAALEYRAALNHYRQRSEFGAYTLNLVAQLERAYLDNGDFEKATAFAAESISLDSMYQETLGREITQKVDQLATAKRNDAAMDLIGRTRQMQPPLAGQFQDELVRLERRIRQAQGENNGPRSGDPAEARRLRGGLGVSSDS